MVQKQYSGSVEVTVLLPAYNEEQNISPAIQRLKELYPDFEILVIDDGSTDKTMSMAIEAGANVWPHPYNIGNGAAIKTGIRCAQGEWLVMMDADGQHNPEDITRLLEHKNNFDMVVGARDKGSDTARHRDIANWVYNKFASHLTRFKIKDLTSGMRLIKTATARQYLYMLPNTFSYPTTLTMAYLRSGRSIKYVPINVNARTGKSKIKLLQDGARFFVIITKVGTLFSPLRVFLPISLLLFLMGLGYYCYSYTTVGRFTNMSALLFNSSLIVGMMGLVSEQISQMKYDRVDK